MGVTLDSPSDRTLGAYCDRGSRYLIMEGSRACVEQVNHPNMCRKAQTTLHGHVRRNIHGCNQKGEA
jgi:hypothetical protein